MPDLPSGIPISPAEALRLPPAGILLQEVAARLKAHAVWPLPPMDGDNPDDGPQIKAEDLPPLSRIARRLSPQMQAAFLRAASAAQGVVDVEALARELVAGQAGTTQIEGALAVLRGHLTPAALMSLQAGFLAGAGLAARDLLTHGIAASFTLINPRAVEWAQGRSAELVVQVTDQTRQGIRRLIERAFTEGRDYKSTARDIRQIVGLTEQQAMAMDRFRGRLTAEGVSPEHVDRRTAKYAEAQLHWRARNIARTEMLTASNTGQQGLWEEAHRAGLLRAERTKRIWIVSRDDRLDTVICEPIDEQERGLKEPFLTGDGREIMHPPAHPSCRCSVGLIFAPIPAGRR